MIASRRWQDWASGLVGVLLLVSPFIYSTTSNTNASWTAYVIGALVIVVALVLLFAQTFEFAEYGIALLGVLLFISPWVMGFAGLASMAVTAWIAGILLFILAGSVILPSLAGRQPAATA